MTQKYIDVYERSDCPPPPSGMRYFDMIGGEKNIRMFIAPENMLRGEFMKQNANALDESLSPVFLCDSISVRQDMAYAVPGFYIINPLPHYSSFDEVPPVENLRLANIKYWIRKGMREALGIEHVHVYYEETEGLRHSHEWILPIYDINESKRIYDFKVNDYLESFKFSEQKNAILGFNKKMRDYVEKVGLAQMDMQIKSAFDQRGPRLLRPSNIFSPR